MSFPALAWASKFRAESAAVKLVLLGYADRHNEETGCAYPSIAWLAEFGSLNRKTVIAAVEKLETAGILSDTGERKGDTKQIKVYRLHIETVPKTEPSQKRNSTEKVAKQSQKRDTDTVRTPSSSTSEDKSSSVEIPSAIKPIHLLEAYNAMAGRTGLPVAKKLEGERLRKARVLVRTATVDDLTEAIDAIERNPWMHGANDKGWRADFDFLLQPKSFNRLIEGSYDRAQ